MGDQGPGRAIAVSVPPWQARAAPAQPFCQAHAMRTIPAGSADHGAGPRPDLAGQEDPRHRRCAAPPFTGREACRHQRRPTARQQPGLPRTTPRGTGDTARNAFGNPLHMLDGGRVSVRLARQRPRGVRAWRGSAGAAECTGSPAHHTVRPGEASNPASHTPKTLNHRIAAEGGSLLAAPWACRPGHPAGDSAAYGEIELIILTPDMHMAAIPELDQVI